MIAMARQRLRPRDGRRTLRFLAGLAMLALAVTLHLPFPAAPPAAPVVALPAVAVSTITVTSADTAGTGEARTAADAAETVPADRTGPVATAVDLPAGRAVQAAGSRAPPLR